MDNCKSRTLETNPKYDFINSSASPISWSIFLILSFRISGVSIWEIYILHVDIKFDREKKWFKDEQSCGHFFFYLALAKILLGIAFASVEGLKSPLTSHMDDCEYLHRLWQQC